MMTAGVDLNSTLPSAVKLDVSPETVLSLLEMLGGDRRDHRSLRPLECLARALGVALYRSGGIALMRDALHRLQSPATRRIVEVVWLGIPGWTA